jgi:putative transposase
VRTEADAALLTLIPFFNGTIIEVTIAGIEAQGRASVASGLVVSGHVFRRAAEMSRKQTRLQPLKFRILKRPQLSVETSVISVTDLPAVSAARSFGMSIPSRNASATSITASQGTFFLTSSVAGKRNLLQSDRSARLFIDVLYHYRAQGNYLLHAFVVMPDHFHVLLTLGSELSVERATQLIKGGFAFRGGRAFGFKAPFWQKGFSEGRIYYFHHFARVGEYIAQNPVRRELVQTPQDYAYSSSHPGFSLDEPPQRLKPSRSLPTLVGTSEDVP